MINDNKDKVKIPTTFIIFGATGDLFRRKIAGSLLNLYCRGFMPDSFQVLGVSRRDYNDKKFRKFIYENSLKEFKSKFPKDDIDEFLKKLIYIQGYFNEKSTYDRINECLLNQSGGLNFCDNKLYYLAVPPKFYMDIFKNLANSGLTLSCSPEAGWTRILVEKPFGRDISTAAKLDQMLGKLFKEKQIFRIDHYLAKDTIRNILFFRFSNVIFEPIWNNNYIEKVEIKLLEDLDIGTRGAFYDNIGALRDVGQNHILQMLALIAMENPKGHDADKIRNGRIKVLKSIATMNKPGEIKKKVIRGQYNGYRKHKDVGKDSVTETYFNIEAHIANKRWKGVPFYLESGKALDSKNTEIVIYFRNVIECLCPKDIDHRNILSIKIFPIEGIFIRFWAKKPGLYTDLEPRDLEFDYKNTDSQGAGEYDKVLLDCMKGDQTLFTSTEEVNLAWKYITPILKNWSGTKLHIYKKIVQYQLLIRTEDNLKDKKSIEKLSKLIRYYILVSTTKAGSGHPTSSLSAVELMSTLFFGGFFRFDPDNPDFANNDRLIFSKGHASPLLYSLWAAAGSIDENHLMTLRDFNSDLEGHPTPRFKYAEASTGSLGQGLSIGFGMALSAKYIDKSSYRTYVLLGDSEMAEGSQWEAIQLASHYKLDNLTAILDVNRLGQRGETMLGRNVSEYERRIEAFNWKTLIINGHDIEEIYSAYDEALNEKKKPTMIIAETVKGKGVSFIEDIDGWHGKALSEEQKDNALAELGEVDKNLTGKLSLPEVIKKTNQSVEERIKVDEVPSYKQGDIVSTRQAYGRALVNIYKDFPEIVVLDAEVSNSTYSKIFGDIYADRFFEMFIAEQNMVGAALGLALRGKIPFISTFAAFFSRAFDQIRMSQYSETNIKFSGSHSGVSIGPDGASQMGLEDIAMFRTLIDCSVYYPSDAVSTEALVRLSASYTGNVYIRTTRMDTPVIYSNDEQFVKGGSKTLKKSTDDIVTVCAAGITLHEALKAYEELKKDNINIRIIDTYSIKPVDEESIRDASLNTKAIITVEDHFPEGGLGEAVSSIENIGCPVYILAVRNMPRSGKPEQLLDYESISKEAIIKKVSEIIK